jgi:hypothetical protein
MDLEGSGLSLFQVLPKIHSKSFRINPENLKKRQPVTLATLRYS